MACMHGTPRVRPLSQLRAPGRLRLSYSLLRRQQWPLVSVRWSNQVAPPLQGGQGEPPGTCPHPLPTSMVCTFQLLQSSAQRPFPVVPSLPGSRSHSLSPVSGPSWSS